ncbi:AMIN-like domain-containing (lipo)protein [Rhizohabitans arisaemae]|uniref:AMIN-like domain-containing (lipo)protein n=1 Tax=Rhizohabitans arisaemae TaxID=2720610 RepID=UPI0024B05135|nr:hypothetical protein [Rhizohabitans arisaemae]
MRRVPVMAIAGLFLLTACGAAGPAQVRGAPSPVRDASVSTAPAVTATTPAPAESTPPPTTEPPASLAPPTGVKAVEVKRSPAEAPLVKGVRTARHPKFTRVVLDLDGVLPGYRVSYVDRLVRDGSGEPVKLKGGAYLQIAMFPANAHRPDGTSTWTGPDTVNVGQKGLRNVVLIGDFEAVVTVGLVLERKSGFRVLELKEPSRLVVDVAH